MNKNNKNKSTESKDSKLSKISTAGPEVGETQPSTSSSGSSAGAMPQQSKLVSVVQDQVSNAPTLSGHCLSAQAQAMIGSTIASLSTLSSKDRAQVLRAIGGAFNFVVQPAISAYTINNRVDSTRGQTSVSGIATSSMKSKPASSMKKSPKGPLSDPVLDQDPEMQQLISNKRLASEAIRKEVQRTGATLPATHALIVRRNELNAQIDARRSSLLPK